jgi:hypothetical protein
MPRQPCLQQGEHMLTLPMEQMITQMISADIYIWDSLRAYST